jgi:uncharacterized membrane protein YphA (DoxX/SURF4 family)
MNLLRRSSFTDADRATTVIRFLVGYVFLMEGIQKFVYAETLGAGRFERIGIPAPEFFGPFVGTAEVLCGGLILAGALTRLAAGPLLIIILVALFTTKLPTLLDRGLLTFSHDARNDLSMLAGLVFLLLKGGGAWSFDHRCLSKEGHAADQS